MFPATLAALLELRSIATHLWLGRHVGLVTWVRLGMSVIGACSILGLGLIADRLFGRRVALAAAWTAALFVPMIDVGAALYSESLLVPLMIGATAATIEYRRTRRPWLLVAAGVMTGLCALTHSDGIVLVLPLGLALWPRGRPSREALVPVAALLAGMVLVIFPWTVRNAAKFDAFVPLSTSLGNTMAGTYNSVSASMSPPGIWLIPSKRREYKPIFRAHPVNGPAQDTALIHRALDYIGQHPGYVPDVALGNTLHLLQLVLFKREEASLRQAHEPVWTLYLQTGCFWLLCLAAVAGCFTRAARAAPTTRWLWLIPGLMYLAVLFMGADLSGSIPDRSVPDSARRMRDRRRRRPLPHARHAGRRLTRRDTARPGHGALEHLDRALRLADAREPGVGRQQDSVERLGQRDGGCARHAIRGLFRAAPMRAPAAGGVRSARPATPRDRRPPSPRQSRRTAGAGAHA